MPEDKYKYYVPQQDEGSYYVDTRSDTTRLGYHEGLVPTDAGNYLTWGVHYRPVTEEETPLEQKLSSYNLQFAINPWLLPESPESVGQLLEIANKLKKYVRQPKTIIEALKGLMKGAGKGTTTLTNRINSRAELAAYEDFQKYLQELEAKGINPGTIVGLTRPRGRLPLEDSKYLSKIFEDAGVKQGATKTASSATVTSGSKTGTKATAKKGTKSNVTVTSGSKSTAKEATAQGLTQRKTVLLKEGVKGRTLDKSLTKLQKGRLILRDRAELREIDIKQHTTGKRKNQQDKYDRAWATGDLRAANLGRPSMAVQNLVIEHASNYPPSVFNKIYDLRKRKEFGKEGAAQQLQKYIQKVLEQYGHMY